MTVFVLGNMKFIAQDIPLFSQKLSNSFIYNPAIAGQQYGSLTLAHQSSFSKKKMVYKHEYNIPDSCFEQTHRIE